MATRTFRLECIADTWVGANYPVMGHESSVQVQGLYEGNGDYCAMMKFSVEPLQAAGLTPDRIVSASLHTYYYEGTNAASYSDTFVYSPISSAWDDESTRGTLGHMFSRNTIDSRNRLLGGLLPASTEGFRYGWHNSVNVGSSVATWLTNPDNNAGLAIGRPGDRGNIMSFYSKESSSVDKRPYVTVVVMEPEPEPEPEPLPPGTMRVRLECIADTWIGYNQPLRGHESSVQVQGLYEANGDYCAMMRFSVEPLQAAGLTPDRIVSAKLHAYYYNGTSATSYSDTFVYSPISSAWDDESTRGTLGHMFARDTIDSRNRLLGGLLPASTENFRYGWHNSVNVGSSVATWLANPDNNAGLAIGRPGDRGNVMSFCSKESSFVDKRPYVTVVVMIPEPEPEPEPLPLGMMRVRLECTADTWIGYNQPLRGHESSVQVQGAYEYNGDYCAMMRFSVKPLLAAGLTPDHIVSAKLHAYYYNGTSATSYSDIFVYSPISSAWDEESTRSTLGHMFARDTIDSRNRLLGGLLPSSTENFRYGWHNSVNVGSSVATWLTNPDNNAGLAIGRPGARAPVMSFYSKESSFVDKRPYMTVICKEPEVDPDNPDFRKGLEVGLNCGMVSNQTPSEVHTISGLQILAFDDKEVFINVSIYPYKAIPVENREK